MVEKLKATISYDGTNFSGFQVQPNKRTIQGVLEDALKKIHQGRFIRIYGSGRTDTKVHAKAQVFHFETDLSIPEQNWQKALNALLPDDIYVHSIVKVPDTFHARFSAIEKEYRYYLWQAKERNVFKRNYVCQIDKELNISAIQKACTYLIGTHDFTTFSSARSTAKGSKERTLYEVTCQKQGQEVEFILRGNGFLYHMVRIIVGVLIDVGEGKLDPQDVKTLLAKKDRSYAGKTMPPQGLYLWNVKYKEE